MGPAKNPLAGPIQPVVSHVSPKVRDIMFYEVHDKTLVGFRTPTFAEPHPNHDKYPNHKLVFIAPFSAEEPHLQKWYYTAERSDQNDYNFERDDQRLVRTYIIPRSSFLDSSWADDEVPADGTADATFTDYVMCGEQVQRIGDPTLDSFFVVVRWTYVNANKIISDSEKGSGRGEEGSTITLGSAATATAVDGSIIVSRNSRLVKGDIWNNSEDRLQPRLGVNTRQVSCKPGFKEIREGSISTGVPQPGVGEYGFSRSLITQDVEGKDALWKADRTYRQDNPVSGSETTAFLGGGVATVSQELVAAGTAADSGFLIIDSKVDPQGCGDSLKRTRTMPGYPTLIDYKYDAQLDSLVKITKTVVDASGAPTGSYAVGDVTEIKAYDKWRSFSIRTEGVGSETTTYLPGVFQFRFPPVLKTASWIGSYAFAGSGDKYDYDYDIALIFDVQEAFSAAVDGRIIRVVTSDPASVVGNYPPINFKPQSHTVGFVTAAWYASDAMVWAKTSARTWQTPLAINAAITLTPPDTSPGVVSINANSTGTIPATSPSFIPTGWVTIGVTTNRLKLGYYEVIVRQINSPGG